MPRKNSTTADQPKAAVVTLTPDQLSELVTSAIAAALAANRESSAEPSRASQSATLPPKVEADPKYLRYFEGKKEVASRLLKEKGHHYMVCRKPHSRKLMVWSELTRDAAKRRGQNPDIVLGKVVWSTYETVKVS